MKRPAVLYALIVLMVAFWSGNYVAGKVALRELSPLLLAGLRIGMAGVMILPLYLMRRTEARPSGKGLARLLVLGVLGVTLNQLFFVVGLSRTSVAHAALLIGLTPILVLLLAALRGLEPMTIRKAAGMLIALTGVAVLKAFEPASLGASTQRATWFGDGFVFLAALFFALFTVFGKEATGQYSSLTMNTVAYVAGGVALLPLTIWEATRQSLAHVSAGAWVSAIYMAMFPSVIAYLIYYYALAHLPATRVSAFSYLQPVFALGLGVVLLGESLGAPVIAGGAVILSGVYLAERG